MYIFQFPSEKILICFSMWTFFQPTTPVLRNGRRSRNSAQAQAHQVEYNKVQKAKRKKSTQLGHEEEERVMRILHKLVLYN